MTRFTSPVASGLTRLTSHVASGLIRLTSPVASGLTGLSVQDYGCLEKEKAEKVWRSRKLS